MESEEYFEGQLDRIENEVEWFISNYRDEPLTAGVRLMDAKSIAQTTIEHVSESDHDLDAEQVNTFGQDVLSQVHRTQSILSQDIVTADSFEEGFMLRGVLEQILSGIEELREYEDGE